MITAVNKTALFFIACCLCFCATAQPRYQAAVDTVPKAGFYELRITPGLSACLRTDFSDLRIRDDKGHMTPYVIDLCRQRGNENIIAADPLPVLTNEIADSGKSVVIFRNKPGGVIGQLLLQLHNTSVTRYAQLSGSNDRQHWYIIDDNLLLERSYKTGKSADNYTQTVNIPASRYTYFKLVINNEHSDPLNIIGIAVVHPGPAIDETPDPDFLHAANPKAAITQKDSSDGRSYLHLTLDKPYHTDRILFHIAAPHLYEREAYNCILAGSNTNCTACYRAAGFVLSSAKANSIDLERVATRDLCIVIENGDNPPLQIDGISLLQKTYAAYAWLEPGRKYTLLAGDSNATQPDYDLVKFRDSLVRPDIGQLGFGPITEIMQQQAQAAVGSGGRQLWLWATIIAAILLLAAFTWRLMKDMKQKGM